MHFSITIDHATVSSEKALAEFEIIRHIKACFACLGYSEDSFVETLAHYLELEHGMTVLPDEEYRNALDEAREEAYEEGREHLLLAQSLGAADAPKGGEIEMQAEVWDVEEEDEEEEEWSSAQWYDAGWKDGYHGDEPDEEMKEDRVYMSGYKNGREKRIAAMK